MNNTLSPALALYNNNRQLVAQISLNGYDIKAGGLLPSTGAMRSFVLVSGDLWDEWNAYASLTLQAEGETAVSVRIAALPVEEDSYGLIEFL